jgi:asparagine synthase (glutamine-hydrolysing)
MNAKDPSLEGAIGNLPGPKMCAIVSVLAYSAAGSVVDETELIAMRDSMAARGPDGAGLWLDPKKRAGLSHRRLSIIDLSAGGHQPMLLCERKLAITFNGEIYNYRELRSALQGKGHQFRSTCDTEVLLHLYAEEGEAMLGKLRGMYAFAIWDGAKECLFLARDPFGIKPLYWADDGKAFRAASQVKGLIAGGGVDLSPEPAGHVGFFLWGDIPEPYTLYRGIHELSAGHSLTVTLSGERRFRSFSSIPELLATAEKATPTRELPNKNLLRSSLCDSIRHHLIADVPVGVFLSSGLDSTTIAALAAETGGPLRTVTLGFEEFKGTANDETPLAEQVACRYGARHETVWVTRRDFENDLDHLLQAMDQPSSDGVNTYFISKVAAQAGLKVALSGLGGDELFGGYPSFHQIPRAVSALRPWHVPAWLGRGFRVLSGPVLKRLTSPKYAGLLEYGGEYGGAYLLRRGMFMPWELPEILDADLARQGWSELQTLARLAETAQSLRSPHLKIAALEMTWYMRHRLLRDSDWASMAHSLEIRVPLVDVELLRSLAPLFASEPRPTKRDMAQTPLSPLPRAVLNRPKTDFIVPVREWLLHRRNGSGHSSSSSASERGLRRWVRHVYEQFTKN